MASRVQISRLCAAKKRKGRVVDTRLSSRSGPGAASKSHTPTERNSPSACAREPPKISRLASCTFACGAFHFCPHQIGTISSIFFRFRVAGVHSKATRLSYRKEAFSVGFSIACPVGPSVQVLSGMKLMWGRRGEASLAASHSSCDSRIEVMLLPISRRGTCFVLVPNIGFDRRIKCSKAMQNAIVHDMNFVVHPTIDREGPHSPPSQLMRAAADALGKPVGIAPCAALPVRPKNTSFPP